MSADADEQANVVMVDSIDELRQQRYTRWKKNSKLHYDYLNTNSTKWPSLTCQIFPDLDLAGDVHRILLSSFTSSQLPEDESLYVGKLSSMKHLDWSSLNNFDADEMEFKIDNSVKLPPKNIVEDLRIKFPAGDCNRARYCPSNPDVIGAASSNGSVYIFDKTKHGTARQKLISGSGTDADYQIHCQLTTSVDASSNEAVSLAWNWQQQNLLATSYSRGQVCVWDLEKFQKASPTLLETRFKTSVDPEGANDVSWMINHDSLLACCGESNTISVLDIRTGQVPTQHSQTNEHHTSGVNACQFSYQNDMLLCSADSDGRVNLWDIRDFTQPVKSWNHGGPVSTLQWNPHFATVVATAGQEDGLVKLWDLAQPEEHQLIFTHGGHMLGVNDISWDHHDAWMMCSVANDNSIQLWRPSSNLVATSNR
ncbi:LANO_0E08746g1_1 [Lachancea nothofagi CBS 11611]|uniref:LANO_0E08746g1_1 n=1 Tax=Lachancea nothofagi CBS 11611 TaxID=1266666 RepID=A0A1G4JVG4_9SACH|nr:LANO_0E08746g1_1 [Lachancea nothofagi CBS 11611]